MRESRLPIRVRLPLFTKANNNLRGHWGAAHSLAKNRRPVRMAVAAALPTGAAVPVTVRLTRIAPKSLDKDDNLNSALKHVRDGVADAVGIDDRNPRYTWVYDQRQPREGDVLVHRPPRIAGGRRARAALSNGYGVVIDIEWPEGT